MVRQLTSRFIDCQPNVRNQDPAMEVAGRAIAGPQHTREGPLRLLMCAFVDFAVDLLAGHPDLNEDLSALTGSEPWLAAGR